MKVSILKTDGGEHSPKQWAYATASRLIDVDVAEGVDDRFFAAQELQLAIARILIKHHTEVQDAEQQALNADADGQCQKEIEVQSHVDAAFTEIMDAAKGTMFESQFQDEITQQRVRTLLGKDFHHSKGLKRAWHQHRSAQVRGV